MYKQVNKKVKWRGEIKFQSDQTQIEFGYVGWLS